MKKSEYSLELFLKVDAFSNYFYKMSWKTKIPEKNKLG